MCIRDRFRSSLHRPLVPINLLAPGSPETLVLFAARVGGLVMVAPVFSTKNVPVAAKTCIGETLIGFALGLGAALLVGAASLAGDVMGMEIGLSGAAVLDPINN